MLNEACRLILDEITLPWSAPGEGGIPKSSHHQLLPQILLRCFAAIEDEGKDEFFSWVPRGRELVPDASNLS